MRGLLQPSSQASRHAFIVDDEVHVRSFVSKALKSAGYATHEFSRVAEVEAALTLFKPGLMLLDLSLGESDAVEMMRSLAASRYSGAILLISGHDLGTLDEVEKIGRRHGLHMLPFLHKPFRLEELKARLTDASQPPLVPEDETEFELALQNQWLELWYQPKIDLKTMLVCGAEGLIRLRHPDRGVLAPSEFLPPPGSPLYKPLTDFVVRRAIADWQLFATERLTLRPAINVPASILQDPDFVANVRRHLPRERKFPGLIVEITETEAIADPELAREVAIQLKLYNIHVAIDDFGAGHSLLARLHELPFAELKIDRSFVHGCAADERKRSMCQNVAALAHRFKVAAVAEGVETRADLQAIIGMGYNAAQGYLFAKPMERGDFVKLLLSRPANMTHFEKLAKVY